MMRITLAGVLAACALCPSPAGASDLGGAFAFFGSPQPTSAYQSELKTRGHVVVDFHGEAAAGCADVHVCEVSGTVTWSPGKTGYLIEYGYRKKGKHFEAGFMGLGDELGGDGPPGTSARVRRSAPGGDGLCADVGSAVTSSDGEPRAGRAIELSLLGASEILRSRCAGPLTDEIRSLLPSRSIDETAVRRGGAKLDFSAQGEFAAHGFAGTMRSDVVVTVRKGTDLLAEERDQELPDGGKRERNRYLEVSYRVEAVSGQVVTNVQGLSDPDLCGPLDSCGLLGTITAVPTLKEGDGTVYAFGSAKNSRRDLRQAVGLVPGSVPRGVRRAAVFEWEDESNVTSDLTRDGAPACTDSDALAGGGLIDLHFVRAHVTARLYGGSVQNGGDPLRTRCPGPSGDDAPGGLATGPVSLRQLGARRATLRLTRGRSFSSNGYRSTTKPSLTVSIRRMRISERVQNDPVFR
jgi:hypothetical protein